MNPRPRLLLFLSLSLLAHGALAFAWRAPIPTSAPGSALRVSLLPVHRREVRQTQATTETRRGSSRGLDKKRTAAMETTPTRTDAGARAATGTSHKRTASVAARPVPAQVAARAQGREAERRIARSLAHYFHYPPVAIRYAWQGTVRIGLRVDRSGNISHVHLVHSSGYAVLDDAALRSTRQVKAIGKIVIPRPWSHFDLQLPVVYRLAQS